MKKRSQAKQEPKPANQKPKSAQELTEEQLQQVVGGQPDARPIIFVGG